MLTTQKAGSKEVCKFNYAFCQLLVILLPLTSSPVNEDLQGLWTKRSLSRNTYLMSVLVDD